MSERKSEELKPCPWCGSEPQLLYYPDDVVAALNQAIFGCWYTRCQVNPKVRTLTTSRLEPGEYEYLVERWNRRPTND